MSDKWVEKDGGLERQTYRIQKSTCGHWWELHRYGQYVAFFPTAGSCKRVADCCIREYKRTDETLHLKGTVEDKGEE